ncbi:hypothetical protein CP532_2950 [Ophiocordyceps camponoti-leonardi (nom. inval.)]|nr:hypothetical protein CP532_2950 [Ophiocordyceps camponoti-leonardi (nom. inval.)]
MRQIFSSALFDFEFLRVLGAAPYHGAEIGECLEAASWIKDGDAESWYHAWLDMGRRALASAEDAQACNDRTAACWAYLRAANYFRASEFFLHCTPDDDRILAAAQESVDAFDNGWVLLDATVCNVAISIGQGQKLPGRLYVPAAHQRAGTGKLPVIIQTGGFDSTQEELYFYGAAGALPRGYAVLSFDGPGQGLPLRRDELRLRHDWEIITGKVIDYLVSELAPEYGLDASRLSIYGASLGGQLALRGASDPRIKACVSVDGPYDLFDVAHSRMPTWFINGWLSGWLSDGIFNLVVNGLASTNFQLRWEFGHSKWVFGVDSPAEVMRAMQRFSLKNDHLSKLRCPTLVTGAADTFYFTPAQNAEKIFEGLTQLGSAEKELWIGKGKSSGGLQAKIGSLALLHHKVFSWLDGQFGIQRPDAMIADLSGLPLTSLLALHRLPDPSPAMFGKIYSFMPNGRVYKVLAAAKLNGLELEVAEYQHMVTNRTAGFLSKFPVGKVPAFEGSDGFCLTESDAIAQYVAQSGPRAEQLLGSDAATCAQIRQWICFTDGEVTAPVLDLVMWRVGMCPYDDEKEVRALARMEKALDVVERHLGGRKWLVGEQGLSLADLTLASALVWAFLHVIDERMRERFGNVAGWYLRTIGDEEVRDVFGPPSLISVRRVHSEKS